MKPYSAAIVSGLLAFALLTGYFGLKDSAFVIGGEYTVASGQVVNGSLNALFARVTVEPGARVRGNVTGVSSDLDIRGAVDGDMLLVQSEAQLSASCSMGGAQHTWAPIHYILLTPQLMRHDPVAAG